MLYINKDLILNENIRSREVRLAGEDTRIIKTEEALRLARESDLDLVMVSPNAKPPVCKIMDYSKYIYEQSKKLKLAKKSQKIVVLKEVRLSPTIEEHDIDIKANNAKKFLSNGDKVKVSIRFRGRQNNNTQMGKKVLDLFITKIGELGVIEKAPQLEGRNMFMIVGPKKQA
ncbi:MAG: translation initiation factor IF-3 [Clostridium sp.]|uniref:translation initiation factor IF-3 n=1 Tax=Clostridium sp. TaxID=1506 RepID=UPI0039EBCC2A